MRLVHYSKHRISELRAQLLTSGQANYEQNDYKPRGLWVSDDDCEDNWRSWCEAEKFNLDRLAVPHDIELKTDANVLTLSSAADIDAFTAEWHRNEPPFDGMRLTVFIDWRRLYNAYDGLIITPYIWERRLEGGATWYYGWDCASGCIWSISVIASIRARLAE